MYGRNSFELLKAEVLFDELFHDKFNAYVFPAFPGAGGSINDGILDAALTPKLIRPTTFAEISGSVSQVAPLAASMGVKFEDIAASLSTLTSQGTPTSEAMTQLKGVFSELSQGSSKVSAEFQKITGKSFKEFVAGGGDTKQALDLLNQAAGKSGKGINELFGSVEAGSAALALTGKGSEKFATDLEAMRNSAGATDAVAFSCP